MIDDIDWRAHTKGLLRAELTKRNIGYRELVAKLGEIGIHESEQNLANKISRGSFTAVFLIQCLNVIGCTTLRLAD
jgi:hypothetical protein